ncbi:MAG: hypothetical protein WC556_12705 [Candidatus Methanoperedens sp.]
MDIFKKKISPEELKTKLSIYEQRLSARENELKRKRQKSRDEAKQALSQGNDREYRVNSRRYGMLDGQVNTISSMVEMAQSMGDVIEMQQGLKEVVEIGADIGKYQKQMGIDTKQLEGAITNIRTSMERVGVATSTMTSAMDAAMSGNQELSEVQDSLRSELLAEMSVDQTQKQKLGDQIKSEMKQ